MVEPRDSIDGRRIGPIGGGKRLMPRYDRSMPSVEDDLYRGPVKRSVTIAGHQTSISLEPAFWSALERYAVGAGLPLNAVVAQIDAERIGATEPPNLASAIRLWLFARSQAPGAALDASEPA